MSRLQKIGFIEAKEITRDAMTQPVVTASRKNMEKTVSLHTIQLKASFDKQS